MTDNSTPMYTNALLASTLTESAVDRQTSHENPQYDEVEPSTYAAVDDDSAQPTYDLVDTDPAMAPGRPLSAKRPYKTLDNAAKQPSYDTVENEQPSYDTVEDDDRSPTMDTDEYVLHKVPSRGDRTGGRDRGGRGRGGRGRGDRGRDGRGRDRVESNAYHHVTHDPEQPSYDTVADEDDYTLPTMDTDVPALPSRDRIKSTAYHAPNGRVIQMQDQHAGADDGALPPPYTRTAVPVAQGSYSALVGTQQLYVPTAEGEMYAEIPGEETYADAAFGNAVVVNQGEEIYLVPVSQAPPVPSKPHPNMLAVVDESVYQVPVDSCVSSVTDGNSDGGDEDDVKPWVRLNMSRKSADAFLRDKPAGCFVVRSASKANAFAISVAVDNGKPSSYHQIIKVTGIEGAKQTYWLNGSTAAPFDSLGQLVQFYSGPSVADNTLPVLLLSDMSAWGATGPAVHQEETHGGLYGATTARQTSEA